MSTNVTVDREGTVTGNTYDKYGATNPVVRRLMRGFERTLDDLFARTGAGSLLDVGCGEGVLTHRFAQRLDGRVVGIDRFGLSAPGGIAMKELGITAEAVVAAARSL